MLAVVVSASIDEVELASDVLWSLGVVAIEERAVDDGIELWTSLGDDLGIITDAAEDYFRNNFKAGQIETFRERLDAINKLYIDVKLGDRYALTYIPGTGCELALNGKPLGTIPGADFAAAYFGIWLGAGCAKPEFRDALLKVR